MDLPRNLQYEATLHGQGDAHTFRASESGELVVVQFPRSDGDLLDGFEESSSSIRCSEALAFSRDKEREKAAAERSEFFIDGRLERHEGGHMWIRPFIERSLRDRVAFKEAPSSRELKKIFLSVIEALQALELVDQAEHGNLSLGNVLHSAPKWGAVRLVDLKAKDAADRLSDKRCLGLMLYQLVNLEFVELDDLLTSVPEDQDWRVLGRGAQQWREICSELLNPYGRYASLGLEVIEQDIRKVADSSKGGGLKLGISLVLVILIALGGFFYWRSQHSGYANVVVDLEQIELQWLELVDAYFDWGAAYLASGRGFGKTPDERDFAQRFLDKSRAGLPAEIIDRLTKAGARMKSAPDEVRAIARSSVSVLELDKSDQQLIVVAHDYLIGIRRSIEAWDVLTRLESSYSGFLASGFEFGASEIQRLLDSVSFENGQLTLRQLYGLQQSAESLQDLQGSYEMLQGAIDLLTAPGGSRFLAVYAEAIEGRLKEHTVDPVDHLVQLASAANDAAEYWTEMQRIIARGVFIEEELNYYEDFSLNFDGFAEWKSLVESYRLLELKSVEGARVSFDESSATLGALTSQINELLEPSTPRVQYDVRLNELRREFNAVDTMLAIERNRIEIEAFVGAKTGALRLLMDEAERRWAEVNPNIGERLEFLSTMPQDLGLRLRSHWQRYLDKEVRPRGESSFSGAREFIQFQRLHNAYLDNFRKFENEYLNIFGGTSLSFGRYEDAIRPLRRAQIERLLDVWSGEAVPVLFQSGWPDQEMGRMADFYSGELDGFDQRIHEYGRTIESVMDGIQEWTLPNNFERILALLEGNGEQAQWGRSAGFAESTEYLKRFASILVADSMVLVDRINDVSLTDFERFVAFSRIVNETGGLSAVDLLELGQALGALGEEIPPSRQLEWNQLLIDAWLLAYEIGVTPREERELLIRNAALYNVEPAMLEGDHRVQFDIFRSLEYLRESEDRFLAEPDQLVEVLRDLDQLSVSGAYSDLDSLVTNLESVELSDRETGFENAAFLKKGWRLVEESDYALKLSWNSYTLNFKLVEGDLSDFFISESECSIGLFNEWMLEQDLWVDAGPSVPGEWEAFLDSGYSAMDDYRVGMRLWRVSRRGLKRGGIEPESSWFAVDPSVTDEYRELESSVFRPDALSDSLPMQQVGGELAKLFVESMGLNLPSPSIWSEMVSSASDLGGAYFWPDGLDSSLSAALRNELQMGSYYSEQKIEASGAGQSRGVILDGVADSGIGELKHLAGNVAEYLYDPDDEVFYVGGGSSLASVAGSWDTLHRLPKRMHRRAYSDVGFRFSFPAPEKSAYEKYLRFMENAWR